MTSLSKGVLYATGKNDTSLYVKPINGGYLWSMWSAKTGNHAIKQIGGIEPIMCDRIKAHWDGFQANQTR
jgi:hypothetical protein